MLRKPVLLLRRNIVESKSYSVVLGPNHASQYHKSDSEVPMRSFFQSSGALAYYGVGADLNLSHGADAKLSQYWRPNLQRRRGF